MLPTPKGWKAELAWAGKKVAQTSSNLGRAGDRTGPCGRKAEILPTAPTTPAYSLLLSKGDYIKCPLNFVCPMKIKSSISVDEEPRPEEVPHKTRSERYTAKESQRNIRTQLQELEF